MVKLAKLLYLGVVEMVYVTEIAERITPPWSAGKIYSLSDLEDYRATISLYVDFLLKE